MDRPRSFAPPLPSTLGLLAKPTQASCQGSSPRVVPRQLPRSKFGDLVPGGTPCDSVWGAGRAGTPSSPLVDPNHRVGTPSGPRRGGDHWAKRASVNLCGQPTDTLGPFKTDNASPPRITATAGTRFVGTDRRVYSLCSSPVGFVRD
jgi:hypothetical protein